MPIYDIVASIDNSEGEARPGRKLSKHIQKLPKNIRPADVTDVLQRLKALDAMRPRSRPAWPDAHQRRQARQAARQPCAAADERPPLTRRQSSRRNSR